MNPIGLNLCFVYYLLLNSHLILATRFSYYWYLVFILLTLNMQYFLAEISFINLFLACRNHGFDDFWSRVIFVDEKTFRSDVQGRLHCWRSANTRYRPENLNLTHHSGHVSLNMFGWMWSGGVGELTTIEGRFTGEEYVTILEDVLLPTVRAMALPPPEPIYLVQDNCPVHKSRVVAQWFDAHPVFVNLFWPARSPDLNPIENLWGDMVNEWHHQNERTPAALERHCMAV